MSKHLSAAALAVLLATANAAAAVWYVDIDNTSGTEDGASWQTAFTSIQSAVNAAYNDARREVWGSKVTCNCVRSRGRQK